MPRPWWGNEISIGGVPYGLDNRDPRVPAYTRTLDSTQGISDEHSFTERLGNGALGWGHSKYDGRGTIAYATSAALHRKMAFLPGPKLTDRTPATVPIGAGSIAEFWDGTAANRRVIITTPRHVYEITTAGVVSSNDLGAGFTVANGMTVAKCYANSGIAAKMYIARYGGISGANYFVRRSAANTYAVTAANKYATMLEPGKDAVGADVLWRADENGKLNQSVADSDPEAGGSWATAVFPTGPTNMHPIDAFQQAKRLIVWRPDGAYTFDNVGRAVPITIGMENYLSDRNGINCKDFNGMCIAPTKQGLVYIDGLTWGVCGPVSANPDARNITGEEVAFSGMVGSYCYSAVYDGADSWIFFGQPRELNRQGSGFGPFVWHGAVAKMTGKQVTDMRPSVVWLTGTNAKMWIACTDGFWTFDLNSDGSPANDSTAGTIYFPEGALDHSGPDVTKIIHSVEYIAPAGTPMSATATWTLEVDVGDGNGWVGPGAGNLGSYIKQTFATQVSGRRPLVRLTYANTSTAELEEVVIRGMEVSETRWLHSFRILTGRGHRAPGRGMKNWQHPETVAENLKTLRDSGWTDLIRLQEGTRKVRVVDIKEERSSGTPFGSDERIFTVTLAEVPQ